MPKSAFIDLLYQGSENENLIFARSVILRLQTEEKKDFLIIEGQKYLRSRIYSDLIVWAKQNFPEFEKVDPSVYSLSVLYQLLHRVSVEIKTRLPESNLPTPTQLEEWRRELAEHEEWLRSITQVDNAAVLDQLKQLNLKTQIELIKNFQQSIAKEINAQLEEYWTPEERKEIVKEASQNFTRNLIERLGYEAQTDKLSSFIWQSIEELSENPLIAAGLTAKKRDKLAAQLTAKITPEKAQQIARAQTDLIKASFLLCPSREKLKNSIKQTLGISEKQAENLICGLEASWPKNSNPTQIEVEEIIRQSLGLQEALTIQKKGLAEEEIIENLAPLLKNYYLAAPLAQQPLEFAPVSKRAVKWGKRLKLDPVIIDNLLRGITPKRIKEEIVRLKKLGRNSEALRLKKLFNKINTIDVEKLPFSLRWRVKRARRKAKLLGFLEKANPFCFGFYRYHFPRGAKYIEKRVESIGIYINYLKEQRGALKEKGFLGKIRALFLKPRELRLRFRHWRWSQWEKLINKIIKNKRLRKALYHLPAKLKPSYWLRPGYWLRKGAGKLLIWAGKKLGKRAAGVALRKIGAALVKYSLKQLFKKGATTLLTTLLGSAAGPVGTAVGFVVGIIDAARFIFSPQGRELIKKVWKKVKEIGTGIIIGLVHLISQFPFTFIFAAAGFALAGPIGGFIGGAIGLSLDLGIKALGGLTGLGQVVANAAAAPITMSTAASLPTALTATTTVATIGTVGSIAGTVLVINNLITPATFLPGANAGVPPPEVEPSENQYFTLEKKAQPLRNITAGTKITYTITITSRTDQITNIEITDDIDTQYLNNILVNPPGTFNPNQPNKEISWPIFNLSGHGSRKIFTYTAQANSSVDNKTKIINKLNVKAIVEGQTINRQISLTLNSEGEEIAQRALAIVNNLQKGFWDFYNFSPDYPNLFNQEEFNCCPYHCYLNNNNPPPNEKHPSGCEGSPEAISNAEAMFWCTWLVIKSYQETGHSVPNNLGVKGMKDNWPQDKFLPPETNVHQLKTGDVIFFRKENNGNYFWAHVGIICNLDNRDDFITVCEANNFAPIVQYTVANGRVQNRGSLVVAGFGQPYD